MPSREAAAHRWIPATRCRPPARSASTKFDFIRDGLVSVDYPGGSVAFAPDDGSMKHPAGTHKRGLCK
jgi:hypothetical protein